MSITPHKSHLRLDPREYTVGWITALSIEYAAATAMLDEQHESPNRQENDDTSYTLGQICGHNVVIVCLPAGNTGIAMAANVATLLSTRFPRAKIGLMVGIGGGVPSGHKDIRLGDVVVSQPERGYGGVLQYDLGKRLPDGKFEQTSHLDMPPRPLLNALQEIQKNHVLNGSAYLDYLANLETKSAFSRQEAGPDQLFRSDYRHPAENPDCTGCESPIARSERIEGQQVQVHYGTIASANSLIKDGIERDRLYQDLGGKILCFEMEAAGLMNNFPCLVIRGICDYADSHKNKKWQPYAAATAAAYAKEVLSVLRAKDVAELAPIKVPWVLPFNRNPQFTGRTNVLEALHLCLQNPQHHPYVAICGLGGSGKSAVAIELAFRTRDKNPTCAIFWVSSFTAETFQSSYREIARVLQIPEADDPEKDILSLVRRELSGEDQDRWLMIVDNVDDEEVLFQTSSNGNRLYDELPRSRHGVVLFTTRDRKIASHVAPDQTYSLGEMEMTEGEKLVRKALDEEKPDLLSESAIGAFLEMLTYLPLAIVQALAFMNANSTPLERYMELLQETRQSMTDLLQEDFNDPNRDKRSRNAVALTWEISFQRIEKENQLAADYLNFFACIAPQNIPRTILPPATSSLQQEKAIGMLTAYSFLTERAEAGSYDVHSLIHHITESRMREVGSFINTAQKVVKRLIEVIPQGAYDPVKKYAPHLLHGQRTADIPEILDEEETVDLLHNVGWCYHSQGEFSHAVSTLREVVKRRERSNKSGVMKMVQSKNSFGQALLSHGDLSAAEKMFSGATEISTQELGLEHRDTLACRGNLAMAYSSQGRYEEAGKLQREVVETSKVKIGVDHITTLSIMSQLASTYLQQGRLNEAMKLQEEIDTSKTMRQVDHPVIIASAGNLALTYTIQGKWAEAEKQHRKVIETSKAKFGADHPNTLITVGNLAAMYLDQGRWTETEELHLMLYEMMKATLGDDHQATLGSRNNLAWMYFKQERWDTANKMFLEIHETCKARCGVDHPDTLTCKSNLASTYREQGRWDEAEKLGLEVLEVRKRVLGVHHPDTLTTMSDLALTYCSQGRWDAAEKMELEVLEDHKRDPGVDHPSTLTVMANLGTNYWHQGRWNEAESLFLQVIELRKEKSGEDHQETLRCMAHLALTYREQGRREEGEALEIQVLETCKRKFGENHPSTLTSLNNLGTTYYFQGRWEEAEPLFHQAMEAYMSEFGLNYPATLKSMSNLASVHSKLGRLDAAEELELKVMEIRTENLGVNHQDTLTSMNQLALIYVEQRKWEAVEPLYAQIVSSLEIRKGGDHSDTVNCMASLGLAYGRLGRWIEAEQMVGRVMESRKKTFGEDHQYTLNSITDLAFANRKLGRLERAKRLEMEVRKIRRRKLSRELWADPRGRATTMKPLSLLLILGVFLSFTVSFLFGFLA